MTRKNKFTTILLTISLIALMLVACGGSKSYLRVEKAQFASIMRKPVIVPLFMEQNIFPQVRLNALELNFSAEYQALINKSFREKARQFDSVLVSVLSKDTQPVISKTLSDSDIVKSLLASHGEFSSSKIYENEYFLVKPEKIAALAKLYPEASSFIFHFANVQRTWVYFQEYKSYVVMPQAAIWYNMVVYDRQGKIIYGGIEESQGQTDAYGFSPKAVAYKWGNYKMLPLEKKEVESAWKGTVKRVTIEPSEISWTELDPEAFKKKMLDSDGLYRELVQP